MGKTGMKCFNDVSLVTPLVSERVLLKYPLNHISSGCYDKMPDWVGLKNKKLIFFRALEVELVRSGCWCALVLVTALFLACRGFILLFSHIMERGQVSFFLSLECHSLTGLGPHPCDLI